MSILDTRGVQEGSPPAEDARPPQRARRARARAPREGAGPGRLRREGERGGRRGRRRRRRARARLQGSEARASHRAAARRRGHPLRPLRAEGHAPAPRRRRAAGRRRREAPLRRRGRARDRRQDRRPPRAARPARRARSASRRTCPGGPTARSAPTSAGASTISPSCSSATCPTASRAELARATGARAVQEELATTLTRATAAVCAGIAAAPIPLADIIPLTTMQVGLVAAIAWIAGRSVDKRGAARVPRGPRRERGRGVRAARGRSARSSKVIAPGGGSVVSATIAFSGTMAIGAAARAYYIRGLSLGEARKAFRREKKDGAAADRQHADDLAGPQPRARRRRARHRRRRQQQADDPALQGPGPPDDRPQDDPPVSMKRLDRPPRAEAPERQGRRPRRAARVRRPRVRASSRVSGSSAARRRPAGGLGVDAPDARFVPA